MMYKDIRTAILLNKSESLALIDRLKTRKLLNGFRGNPPLNKQVFAEVLVRLGELGRVNPRIREIDINPLIIGELGNEPVVADARMSFATSVPLHPKSNW